MVNMRQAWGVLMVKKWVAMRSRRYTVYARHSIEADGYTLHYIDNCKKHTVRIAE